MIKNLFSLIICIYLILPKKSCDSQDLQSGQILSPHQHYAFTKGVPWDAIGQVNVAGYRKITLCTGTLVADDIVLTAGHCLIDPQTGQEFQAEKIHFLAGVHGEQNKGHAGAKCLKFLKNFLSAGQNSNDQISINDLSNDAALIILSRNLNIKPALLFENLEVLQDQTLIHVAYPGKQRFIPKVQLECHLILTDQVTQIWSTDCQSSPGSSGGPLFILTEKNVKLAAIMVGLGKHSYALPISVWKNLLDHKTCP